MRHEYERLEPFLLGVCRSINDSASWNVYYSPEKNPGGLGHRPPDSKASSFLLLHASLYIVTPPYASPTAKFTIKGERKVAEEMGLPDRSFTSRIASFPKPFNGFLPARPLLGTMNRDGIQIILQHAISITAPSLNSQTVSTSCF